MVVMASSVQAFFREALESAVLRTGLKVTEESKVYIVHLLNEFCRSEKAFAGVNYQENIVLIDMLQRAYEAEEHEALTIFRHLGDSSLYLLGYFGKTHHFKLVSKAYYEGIGSESYARASALSRAKTAKTAAIFMELSEQFGEFVELVTKISTYNPKNEGN